MVSVFAFSAGLSRAAESGREAVSTLDKPAEKASVEPWNARADLPRSWGVLLSGAGAIVHQRWISVKCEALAAGDDLSLGYQ